MKSSTIGSIASLSGWRAPVVALLAIAAMTAAGCEQALQVAPTSSVLQLTSTANAVPLNGSLSITVTLVESSGKAVADGTLVSFASTLGTLDPVETRVSNGRATVRLLAGGISGVAVITASSGGAKSNALEVRVGPVPGRIALTASMASPNSATVTASVFDSNGTAVTGVPVTFTSTTGTLSNTIVTTDGYGQAFTTLFGNGDAVVAAETSGVKSSVAVRFGFGGTLIVNVTMNPMNPTRRQTILFTANVSAQGGGLAVPIERYEWDFGPGGVVITTGNTTSRAYDNGGAYTLTVRVYGVDGSVGLSQVQYFVD